MLDTPRLPTLADRLKRTAAKKKPKVEVPKLLARPTEAKKKAAVPAAAPASRGSQRPSTVSGDWSKVLLGGKGVGSTSAFWSSSSVRGGAHTGVDIGSPNGTPLHVPVDGVVVFAGFDGAYGNSVMVKMADGNYMKFGHLSSIGAKVGQNVGAGEFIGRTGSTGNSTGPHLHIEVRTAASKGQFGNRESWRFADPIKYLNSNGKEAKPFTMDATDTGAGGGSGAPGGGGGGSTSGGSGGAGGGGSYGYSKKEMYQYLSANFGDIDTLMALDKEMTAKGDQGKSLKWAIDQLVKKRITSPEIAYTYLNQTAFFKKYGADVSKNLILEKQRPGVATASVEKTQAAIQQNMDAAGIQLPPEELNKLARNAWVYGWNDQQINAQIAASSNSVLGGGAWDKTINDVVTYADEYGVGFSDAQHNQLKSDYLSGRGTEAIQKQMREQAASTYAVFADRINAGESTRAITDAYFRMAADLLEVDQNSIEWDDPLFKNGKAFTATDPTTGQPAVRNLADFEKDLKADSRWVNTKNAKETLTNGAYNIMQRMGMAG